MVSQADHVEWMVVDSESEALLLEHNLIKEFQPRYNVRLKDDKSYPWLAVTVNDEWPRPAVVRGRKRSGVRYFGPYPNVGAIRGTLDLLLRSFPVRTCSDTKFRRHERLGRPCLLYHIERCSGPCVGAVTHEDYDRLVDDLVSFLTGDTRSLERGIESAMQEASRTLEFERASVLRDKLEAVRAADAVRQMELASREDLDVFGMAGDELEAAVQVFHVRSGKVVGRLGPVRGQGGGSDTRAVDGTGPGRRLCRPGIGNSSAGTRAHHAGGRRCRRGLPDRAPVGPRRPAHPPPGNQARSPPDRGSRTPGSPSSATACNAPRTTTAGPGPSSRSKRSWDCRWPPSASSATT